LAPGLTSYDALRAVFPAGTVSGAPKVRAMEIIDELEPCPRGLYAGAIGYFSSNGSCDFAITIRSIIINKQRASIQAGAGIVIDSVPKREWKETQDKAYGILFSLKEASKKR
jgi:anthranilate synthase component 1